MQLIAGVRQLNVNGDQNTMDLKIFLTVFGTIFLAELGDKTQLATLLYATDSRNPRVTIFIAAATALVLAVALSVFAGSAIAKYIAPKYLAWIAGFGFVAIGIWTIVRAGSGIA